MAPTAEEEEGSSMDVDTPEPKAADAKKKNENVTPSASAADASKYPDMALAQSIHRLAMITGPEARLDAEGAKACDIPSDLSDSVMKQVGGEEVENPSLYRHLMTTLGWEGKAGCLSDADLAAMESRHKTKMEELEKKVDEAKENAGDMEVLDARFDVARFAAKSLSKDEALDAYEKVLALPKLSSGKKIDCLMEGARVALFHGDNKKTAELIEKAAKLAEDGGDWDRRNRLKVYSSLSKLLVRDVKDAASLLIDCIATFSCTELCSYTEFVVYTIVSNILYIPRTELKSKIIDGPEILSVANEIPVVARLVNALYDCDYKGYLQAMVELQPILVADRYLQPHSGYIMRELHVLGYKQFLDSYKSVTLESMVASFGVGTEYLDLQLSRFIAAGRLTAKIDKFGGVVETNRPDLKNAQYKDMIQKGDLLLNRIQKLARVVDL
mmetsp:Transcript_14606/g.31664  ORF Transcript_14606/g.31664 Transcript_14606/m.31664 type:complete len:441 (+) Transcript_14606:76-1398(+)